MRAINKCVIVVLVLLILTFFENLYDVINVNAQTSEPKSSAFTVPVSMLTAGGSHTCALTKSGGAKCWGWNERGNLGDGTAITRKFPVSVLGLSKGLVSIDAYYNHTCVIDLEGTVRCWGLNHAGQLGDGTTTTRSSPVAVKGLASKVISIATGTSHTCVIIDTGGVKCWGQNNVGQLGNGTRVDSLTPINVKGLSSGIIAIDAAEFHTCVITTTGAVKCWGENYNGQIGNGTTTMQLTPVNVIGLGNGVKAVTLGRYHSCAITSLGNVKCWGSNSWGQLGNGSRKWSSTPVDVIGLKSKSVNISAGEEHTCVITSVGSAKCWGNNEYGQLGNGQNLESFVPVDVRNLTRDNNFIVAGGAHTCAISTIGVAKCWGSNGVGTLGDGTTIDRNTPVAVKWLLNPPVLVAPLNGIVTTETTPTFSWKSVPSGYKYQIQISLNNKFTILEQNNTLSPGILNWTATTLTPGKHFWRVRAITKLGEKGTWSYVRAFTKN